MALPTCECVRGLPPYDRLTAIYQAAAELSGDGSLPSELCVAGVPPFRRFGYIYAAFRVLADDDSLPSMECIEALPVPDQVTEIYRAVLLYTGAEGDYLCARGLPLWQQWKLIYTSIYANTSDPAAQVDPVCANTTFDILSDFYCALKDQGGCVTPQLLSATLDGLTLTLLFSEPVTGHTGFSMTVVVVPATLTYQSGEGTNTLVFESDTNAEQGDSVTLSYSPGDVANGDCTLEAISDFPVFNSLDLYIPANGWNLQTTFANESTGGTYALGFGANHNPATGTPKIVLSVTSLGYDTSGIATTTARTVYGVQQVRNPFPDQVQIQETQIGSSLVVPFSLSDYIFATDTATGNILAGVYTQGTPSVALAGSASNDSTATSPEIISGWAVVPFQRVTSSFVPESFAVHQFAKDKKPIACTKFMATDGVLTTAAVIATDLTKPSSDTVPLGLYVGSSIGLSSLADGLIYVNREEFPWVGTASKTTVGGSVAPYFTDGPLPIYKGGTFVYAYVQAGGSGVGATVSTNPAIAEANPFATSGAAAGAIANYNIANGSHGGHVRFLAGTHTLTDSGVNLTTSTWLILERDPNASMDDVIINDCVDNPGAYFRVNLLCVRNLRFDYGKRLIQGTPAQAVWVDNCKITKTGGTTGLVYNFGIIYATSNTGSGGAVICTDGGDGTPQTGFQLARNNNNIDLGRPTRCWIYNREAGRVSMPNAANSWLDGAFVYGTTAYNVDVSGIAWMQSGNYALSHGFALVLALVEVTAGSNPALAIFADSNTLAAKNIILWHCTIAGERTNFGYAESITAAVTQCSIRSCAHQWLPTKDDIFSSNGAFVGSWPFMFEVGCRANHSEFGGTQINFDLQRIGLNSTYAPAQGSNSLAGYTLDASKFGTGAGNGNYYPTGASILRNKVAAGDAVIPFDLVGNSFDNNGHGTAGVYQRTEDV